MYRSPIRSTISMLLAASCCLLTGPRLTAQVAGPNAELTRKIDELIVKLDDENFQVREDAERAIVALGDAAIAAVTKASRATSAEVKQRAGRILRELRRTAVGLKHVATIRRDDLPGVCSLVTSADGKFLYAAAFQTGSIVVFRRDAATGALEHVQSLTDEANLGGVTCLKLSPSGKQALAVSFRAQKVALLARDSVAGTLTVSHAVGPELAAGSLLQWPIDGTFSPDGKHVYVVDDRAAAVAVFEASDKDRLTFVQLATGREGCLEGARGIAMHPDGTKLVVASNRAATLSVLARDAVSGRVEVRQVIKDGEQKVTALLGVHGVCVSSDGKHAYATVGRFQGDQAVAAYRFDDGKLSLVQELIGDKGELVDFQGGNGVFVSGDGLNVYACGTVSRSLACLKRNPQTGELSFVATLQNATTGTGGELGAADVEGSPDGRFVHVALESEGAISVFERTGKK